MLQMPSRLHFRAFLALLVLLACLLLPGLGSVPLTDWDENAYSEASKQMLRTGNFLEVIINGQPLGEKPPLFFWLQALSFWGLGISEFSARLPSVVVAVVMLGFCYGYGRWLVSGSVGLLWAGLFLTALLPSIHARSAVMEHAFNAFIGMGALLLFRYDREQQNPSDAASGPSKTSRPIFWLMLASACLGLAVLTKSPVGGLIPLVAFGSSRIGLRNWRVPWLHFVFCAGLSLLVALSWYFANAVVQGVDFVWDQVLWQWKMTMRPMEGHDGPWYYHWGVAVVGLMPWTPLLLLDWRLLKNDASRIRPLLWFCWGWVLFVLVLFTVARTKLPHHSSSIYLPLPLLLAILVERHLASGTPFPRRVPIVLALLGGALTVFFVGLPHAAQRYVEGLIPGYQLEWPLAIYWVGAVLGGLFLLGAGLFWRQRGIPALVALAGAMVVWTHGLWQLQVPLFTGFVQAPVVSLVRDAHARNRPVVLYRTLSFAALFYGDRPVPMVHVKFPYGLPDLLDHVREQEVAVVTERKHEAALRQEHPLVRFVRHEGNYALYRIPPQSERALTTEAQNTGESSTHADEPPGPFGTSGAAPTSTAGE